MVPQEDSIQSGILNFSVGKLAGLPSLAHDSLASSPIQVCFFTILNVYMPCTPQEKQLCWNTLINLPDKDRSTKLIVA
jgi:hypothetical protein